MNLRRVGGGKIKIIKYFMKKKYFQFKEYISKIKLYIKNEVLKFCLTEERCDIRISEET